MILNVSLSPHEDRVKLKLRVGGAQGWGVREGTLTLGMKLHHYPPGSGPR